MSGGINVVNHIIAVPCLLKFQPLDFSLLATWFASQTFAARIGRLLGFSEILLLSVAILLVLSSLRNY